jgi:DeoR family suf operon transcriptional repressor
MAGTRYDRAVSAVTHAVEAGPIGDLPATRRGILMLLRRRGEASAAELAAALGVSQSAVRQQLGPLTAAGLVAHRRVGSGPGRRRHLHRLAPAAEELFPKRYDDLTVELLADVEAEDPELLARAFARRRDRRIERARTRLAGRDFDERVAELARILDDDGYLAEARREPDGSWLVTEHNCAILDVARRWGHACVTEIEFLRAVLPDARVERVAHIMAGAHVCSYAIRLVEPEPGPPGA